MSALRETQEMGYCGQVKQNAARGLILTAFLTPRRRCDVPSEGLLPMMMHDSPPIVSRFR